MRGAIVAMHEALIETNKSVTGRGMDVMRAIPNVVHSQNWVKRAITEVLFPPGLPSFGAREPKVSL